MSFKLSDFLSAYHEDLYGQLTAVETSDDTILLFLECYDWVGETYDPLSPRKFVFEASGVVESSRFYSPQQICEIGSTRDLLCEQDYRQDWLEVYFRSRPSDAEAVIGRLYENHERLASGYRDLRSYLVANSRTLNSSSGLLLHGPSDYAERQLHVVEDLLTCYTLRSQREPREVTGLYFDQEYVICDSIRLREIADQADG